MARNCIDAYAVNRANVIKNNGQQYSHNSFSSLARGIRLKLGSSFFFANTRSMNAVLTRVEKDDAAAAPAHPNRKGHTQSNPSPAILIATASDTTARGVNASRVAKSIERETLCARAAQEKKPRQYMYADAAG
jgi:hypothetical protein